MMKRTSVSKLCSNLPLHFLEFENLFCFCCYYCWWYCRVQREFTVVVEQKLFLPSFQRTWNITFTMGIRTCFPQEYASLSPPLSLSLSKVTHKQVLQTFKRNMSSLCVPPSPFWIGAFSKYMVCLFQYVPSRWQHNILIQFSVWVLFKFHSENGSIINSFHIVAPNSLKPSQCTHTHQEKIPRAHREAL